MINYIARFLFFEISFFVVSVIIVLLSKHFELKQGIHKDFRTGQQNNKQDLGKIIRSANKNQPPIFYEYVPLHAIKLGLLAGFVMFVYDIALVFSISWKVVTISSLAFLSGILLFLAWKLHVFSSQNIKVLKQYFKDYFQIVIIGLIFFVVLYIIRGLNPELGTTEKPMDYSFIASFLRQDIPPFENPWYAGFLINYYFLGQFLLSVILYIARIPPWIGYNLAINIIAIWAFEVILELFYFVFSKILFKHNGAYAKSKSSTYKTRFIRVVDLRYFKIVVFLGAIFLLFAGNMYYIIRVLIDFFKTAPVFKGLFSGLTTLYKNNFFYPDSTRLIPFTINEYPAYSILLGDLHGHYIVLPFVISFISLLFWVFFNINQRIQKRVQKDINIPALVLIMISIFIASSNSWDVINLGTLGLIFFLYQLIKFIDLDLHMKFLLESIRGLIPYILFGVVIAIPFLKYFVAPTDGIGFHFVLDFKYYPSLWGQHIVLLFILIMMYRYITKQKYKKNMDFENFQITSFFVSLVIAGIILILLTQFFYIKDVFYKSNAPYFRANTVFKIYYSAWIFLSLGIVGTFIHLLMYIRDKQLKQLVIRVYVLIVVIFSSYFVLGSIQRFGLLNVEKIKTKSKIVFTANYLDGLKATSWFNESDVSFIKFLYSKDYSKNLIIESINYNSYSATAKYCIYAGGRCLIGWPMHNMQWYGGFNGQGLKIVNDHEYRKTAIDISKRVDMIKRFYKDYDLSIIPYLKYEINSRDLNDMTNFHFLVYSTEDVQNVQSVAENLQYLLKENAQMHCNMMQIRYVYDIVCKNFEKHTD